MTFKLHPNMLHVSGAESQKGQKRQSFPRNPCHGSIRTTLCVCALSFSPKSGKERMRRLCAFRSADIFLDPVANDLPKTEARTKA